MIRFDIQQIKTFISVAEEEQLSKGAEKNHISISAASNQIKCLEQSLRINLFERSNRSLNLTESGKLILIHAKKLLEEANSLEAMAKNIEQKTEGFITIGESTHNSYETIGNIIRTIKLENPLIKFKIKSRTSSNIFESLKNNDIDIGYVIGDIFNDIFNHQLVDKTELCIAASPKYSEILKSNDWKSITELPWIVPLPNSSTIYTNILLNLFNSKGLKINAIAFFDSSLLGEIIFKSNDSAMIMEKGRALKLQREEKAFISDFHIPPINKYMVYLKSRENENNIKKYVETALKLI